MKIRTGFISNSSSSSFIVALPHKPKDVEELKKMLFGKQEWHYTGYYSEGDSPTQQIAENVFRKIGKKATIKDMVESIVHGWFDGFPDMLDTLPGRYSADDDSDAERIDFKDPDRMGKLEKKWAIEEKENGKRARAIVDAFRRINDDKYIVVMSFSDNDGEAVEEHSGIFHRVRSIRTSYH
jgi:hypothetical protein